MAGTTDGSILSWLVRFYTRVFLGAGHAQVHFFFTWSACDDLSTGFDVRGVSMRQFAQPERCKWSCAAGGNCFTAPAFRMWGPDRQQSQIWARWREPFRFVAHLHWKMLSSEQAAGHNQLAHLGCIAAPDRPNPGAQNQLVQGRQLSPTPAAAVKGGDCDAAGWTARAAMRHRNSIIVVPRFWESRAHLVQARGIEAQVTMCCCATSGKSPLH